MNRSVLSIVTAMGLASGLVSELACGQPATHAPSDAPMKTANQPPTDPSAQLPPGASSQPLVSVEFPNGTVAQYIAALKKANPDTPINIVASDRAAKQTLGSISLKNVPVSVAAFSIRVAASTGTMIWDIADIDQRVPVLGDVPVISRFFTNHAYQVDCQSAARRPDDVVVQALSLQAIVLSEDAKVADAASAVALTAIQTGLALRDPENPDAAELKFHPDSGLLFVRGTRDEVQLVSQIVSRLRDDATSRRDAAERRAREEQLRAIAVKDADLEIQLHEMELREAERGVTQLQKERASGAASAYELSTAEMNLGRAKLAVERAMLDKDRARLAAPIVTPQANSQDTGENSKIQRLEAENENLRQMLQTYKALSKIANPKASDQAPK